MDGCGKNVLLGVLGLDKYYQKPFVSFKLVKGLRNYSSVNRWNVG